MPELSRTGHDGNLLPWGREGTELQRGETVADVSDELHENAGGLIGTVEMHHARRLQSGRSRSGAATGLQQPQPKRWSGKTLDSLGMRGLQLGACSEVESSPTIITARDLRLLTHR